ncbi:MAG: hypothetical protein IKA74_07970 [Clostridia bacterium]|nr:hypothetical protein [Clostridia bacterium]
MSKMDKELEILSDVILAIKDKEECKSVLLDLCTNAEIKEMSRRVIAAKMLYSGEPYLSVTTATGLSTTTISRVSRALKQGSGYAFVIPRVTKSDE